MHFMKSTNQRHLIEDCSGWNRKLWADAVEFALERISNKFQGLSALEIGAGEFSSLAPIFKSHNVDIICSYYGADNRERIRSGNLRRVQKKHAIGDIPLSNQDAFDLKGKYDLIILKSVLGGLARGEDYQRIKDIIDGILSHLNEGGLLISIDNQSNPFANCFRKKFGAGKNLWTYLDRDRFSTLVQDRIVFQKGFGYVNFAHFNIRGYNLEYVNNFLYYVDKVIIRIFCPKANAVLVTILRK